MADDGQAIKNDYRENAFNPNYRVYSKKALQVQAEAAGIKGPSMETMDDLLGEHLAKMDALEAEEEAKE